MKSPCPICNGRVKTKTIRCWSLSVYMFIQCASASAVCLLIFSLCFSFLPSPPYFSFSCFSFFFFFFFLLLFALLLLSFFSSSCSYIPVLIFFLLLLFVISFFFFSSSLSSYFFFLPFYNNILYSFLFFFFLVLGAFCAIFSVQFILVMLDL